MPIARLLRGSDFDAADVKIFTSVFEDSLREMHLDRADPIAVIVAKNVIRFARTGERDPTRLRELATEFLRDQPKPALSKAKSRTALQTFKFPNAGKT